MAAELAYEKLKKLERFWSLKKTKFLFCAALVRIDVQKSPSYFAMQLCNLTSCKAGSRWQGFAALEARCSTVWGRGKLCAMLVNGALHGVPAVAAVARSRESAWS